MLVLLVLQFHATRNTSKMIVNELLILKSKDSKQRPSCRMVLSKPIIRHDDGKANLTISNVNKHLAALQSEYIDNYNVLNRKDYI